MKLSIIIKNIFIILCFFQNYSIQTSSLIESCKISNKTAWDVMQAIEEITPKRKGKNTKYFVVEKEYPDLLKFIKSKDGRCLPLGFVLDEPLDYDQMLIVRTPTKELQKLLWRHNHPILARITKCCL
ncbi:MAG: hypothetical protein ACXWL5_01160 [Candidatus Chromulinivorax sp.]